MSNDLYFIPIIAKALQQKDTDESLRQAFDEIESLGQQPDYQRGYQQFQKFMHTVSDHTKEHRPGLLENNAVIALITELATSTFEGTDQEKQMILRTIQSHPQWQAEYGRFTAEMRELQQAPTGVSVSILRENEPFRSLTFTKSPDSKTIDKIVPGRYTVALATGRIIWQGLLTERDLIWTEAYPGRALRLSADTGEPEGEPTQQVSALEGDIVLRVFAGLESGRIEITMH
jgi:hypothetical protein